jgi:hypothetical protein
MISEQDLAWLEAPDRQERARCEMLDRVHVSFVDVPGARVPKE